MLSPMQLPGKRDSRSSSTAVMTGANKALFYVLDGQSKRNFLIDTGAEVIVPATRFDRQKGRSALTLLATNGSKITTLGSRAVTIDLPQGKFKWTFVVANVAQPLLSDDLLRAHSLFSGCEASACSKFTVFLLAILWRKPPGLPPQLNALCLEQNVFAQLLAQFPQITTPHFCKKVAKYETVHHIVTKGPPIHARPRRLSPSKLTIARYDINEMLNMRIIGRSASPWALPLHMVQKPAGRRRPCGSYRRLNSITEADRYVIPHIQDFSARLSRATVFCKVNLMRG